MQDVPSEIWLHIAQYIPDEDLRRMLGVNHLFFDLSMNIRYRNIIIGSLNTDALKKLARLRDPAIARRVRGLHLRLEVHVVPRATPSLGFRRRLKAVLHLTRPPTPATGTSIKPVPFEHIIDKMIAIFPDMVQLEEFSIDSWNWPTEFDPRPFFSAAWSSFGRNLRRLSLSGHLEGLRVLIASQPPLNSLRELDLEFANNLGRTESDSVVDENILVTCAAPFINSLAPQLLALRIWSWASTDLSSFFKHMSPFPVLRVLGLHAAFNKAFKEDPTGLAQLLHTSSATLQLLQLRLNPSGFINPTSELLLSTWLSETIMNDEKIAAGLKTLQLYPSTSEAGLDTLIVSILRSVDTLTTLVVRDRYLHYDEIVKVITALSSHTKLTSLRLNVWRLSTDLIDVLAKNLPNLKQLTLTIGEHPSTTSFVTGMLERQYDNWKLYDIGIWQGGVELDNETMQLLKKCIPSLCSFGGEGIEDAGSYWYPWDLN